MIFKKLPYFARLILAVILAPIAGDIVVMVVYGFYAPRIWDMFVAGLAFAYPTTIFLGLPFHFALRKFRKHHYGFYLLGGFLIGTIVLSVYFSDFALRSFVFLYGGIPGSIIAIIARWIVGGIEPQSQK